MCFSRSRIKFAKMSLCISKICSVSIPGLFDIMILNTSHTLRYALYLFTKYEVGQLADLYKVPDAVPPIPAVSSHVAADKDPSEFRSIFSDNLQPIATRGKKARGTLLAYWSINTAATPNKNTKLTSYMSWL